MYIVGIIVFFFICIFMIYAYIPSYYHKRKFFSRKQENKKIIYLTFDDGPSEYTDILLNVLKEYDIKASFFCVANFAQQYRNTIEKMKKDSHIIALHSLKHKNAMLQGIHETKLDLEKSLKIMEEMGIHIQYYRPPWGDVNLYLLKRLKKDNIKLILWNVMAQDWRGNTTEDIIANKLLKRVKSGDIICLHDGRGKKEAPLRTINALRTVIPIFLEKGYVFKTIDEYES